MTWWEWALVAVGINWLSPLLTWAYPLVMWLIFGDFTLEGFYGPFAKFRLMDDVQPGGRVKYEGRVKIVMWCSAEEVGIADDYASPQLRVPRDNVNALEPWHSKLWRGWGGVGLYGFLCYRDEDSKRDDAWVRQTLVHESTHCWQWWAMGLLFWVSYLGHMLFIWLFQKSKHPYLDCWAERMARKRAGQQVDYSPNEWPDGPTDRWPWW